MTVAPSACLDVPSYESVFQGLKACQRPRLGSVSLASPIASLCFSVPAVDPLGVLLALAPAHQPQCYLEAPTRRQAIAAWGSLLMQEVTGRDRFQQIQHHLQGWQHRIQRPDTMTGPGPYFFNGYTFFEQGLDSGWFSGTSLGGAPSPESPDPTEPDRAEENGLPGGPTFAPGTLLLCPWQVVRHQGRCWVIANVALPADGDLAPLSHTIHQQLRRIGQIATSGRSRPIPGGETVVPVTLSATAAATFCRRVQGALEQIRQGTLSKQVVAYALDVVGHQPWRRDHALHRLRSQHPDCYIFSFGTGNTAHFIGASPERLLSIRQGRLITDALAGSAPRGPTPASDRRLGQALLNSPKEQQEHRLVVDFIVERLRSLGVKPRYGTPPGLLRLSHIQHLHTPICGEVPSQLSPLALVAALHPTPAVAGVPTAAACAHIRHSEHGEGHWPVGDHRGPYAAPFGWIDHQGNSEFIVGIRSALLQGTRARLFAGAGIVAGSDPERELAEIQLKLQALAEALG